jgi:hypothetical protein
MLNIGLDGSIGGEGGGRVDGLEGRIADFSGGDNIRLGGRGVVDRAASGLGLLESLALLDLASADLGRCASPFIASRGSVAEVTSEEPGAFASSM